MSWKATRNSLVCAGALLIAASPAGAGWDTRAPETAFVFQGRPVDPDCVNDLIDLHQNVDSPMQLTQCGSGNATYKLVAHSGERFVLVADDRESHRTFLATVRLKDGVLSLVSRFYIAAGELPAGQCSQRVLSPRVEGNVLRWSTNLTSYDVIAASGLEWDDAFKDLDMGVCVGRVRMEFDLDKGATDPRRFGVARLASVTLKGPLDDRSFGTPLPAHQHCFDAFFNKALTGRRAQLNAEGTKAFTDGFLQTCHMKRP